MGKTGIMSKLVRTGPTAWLRTISAGTTTVISAIKARLCSIAYQLAKKYQVIAKLEELGLTNSSKRLNVTGLFDKVLREPLII